MERRVRKKGVDGVMEEDQQGLGNWKHKSDEEGRQAKGTIRRRKLC